MAEEKPEELLRPENSFEIKVKIQDIDMEENDVNAFYVFRTPIAKHGSFASIILPMTIQSQFLPLDNMLQKNTKSEIEIDIWMTDPTTTIKQRHYKKIQKITTKTYTILACNSIDRNKDPNNQTILVRLMLVNPIFYNMNITNGFNDISFISTPMDILTKYEDYLISTYGSTAFEFIKVGFEENLNNYTYEQIMCRSENDFKIPDFLWYNKKMINSVGYYFFDDFRIVEDKTADICGLAVNIYNKDLFKEIDIHGKKYVDSQNIKLIDTTPCFDVFSPIMTESPRVVIKDKDTTHSRNDEQDPIPTKNIKTKGVDSQFNKTRKMSAGEITVEEKDKRPAAIINLYAPDDKDTCSERFKIVQEQSKDIFRAYQIYEVNKCYPDLFQFDRKYNMDVNAKSEYGSIPLNIINIFRKETKNETKMYHGVRIKMIKLKPDDDI